MDPDSAEQRSPDEGHRRSQAEVGETRTERRRRQTRHGLLEAGIESIAAAGVEGVTIAMVTEHADVALGTFYNHFADRAHFLQLLFVEATLDWLGTMRAAQTEPFRTEADHMAAVAMTLVDTATARPSWGSFYAEVLGRDELAGDSDLADMIAGSIERGLDEGCFAVRDATLASRLAVAVLRTALVHGARRGFDDELAVDLASTLLRALGTADRFVPLIVDRAAGCIGRPT